MPAARHRCDISLKGAALHGRNDEEMEPANFLHAFGVIERENIRLDFALQRDKTNCCLLNVLNRGGYVRRKYCSASISLATALAPQLFLNGCTDAYAASILAILSEITQAQFKFDSE